MHLNQIKSILVYTEVYPLHWLFIIFSSRSHVPRIIQFDGYFSRINDTTLRILRIALHLNLTMIKNRYEIYEMKYIYLVRVARWDLISYRVLSVSVLKSGMVHSLFRNEASSESLNCAIKEVQPDPGPLLENVMILD